MFVGTKIEGEPDLKKDKHSKAIINTNTPEKYKQLQKAFIKYNDKQDQFRNVKKTWRQLLPDLARAIDNNLIQQ